MDKALLMRAVIGIIVGLAIALLFLPAIGLTGTWLLLIQLLLAVCVIGYIWKWGAA